MSFKFSEFVCKYILLLFFILKQLFTLLILVVLFIALSNLLFCKYSSIYEFFFLFCFIVPFFKRKKSELSILFVNSNSILFISNIFFKFIYIYISYLFNYIIYIKFNLRYNIIKIIYTEF